VSPRPQRWAVGVRGVPAARPRPGRVGRAGVVEVVAAAMDEAALQAHVAGLVAMIASHHRVKISHFHAVDSRRITAGWPDSVIVGPRGVLFRELKTQKEKPRPAQQVIIDQLAAAGLDVGVWRPEDWLTHRVHREILAVAWPEGEAPAALTRAWGAS
jgi:hypothetical protein